jgi:hypothetical protein
MERTRSAEPDVGGVELALRVARTGEGRLEGTLHRSDQAEEIAFSGTLDLLKALETVLDSARGPLE